MIDVTALGEILIDFTPCGKSESGQRIFEQNPGGAPANVLACLNKCGKKTAFIGKVGNDMHGQFLVDVLNDSEICTDGVVVDDSAFTTLAFVALSDSGERSFSFARKPGADTCLRQDELKEELIRDSKEVAIEGMRSVISYVDVMKISDEETALLTDIVDPEGAAKKLVDMGVSIVAVTLGVAGALVCTKEGVAVVLGYKANMVDTTGAGDSFWGGFLNCLLESGKRPSEVSLDEAARFAKYGNAVASLCVEKRGAIPAMPTIEEIQGRLNGKS